MGQVLHVFAALEDAGECPTCGVRFGMPPRLLRTLRGNKKSFYCPNGHEQSFRESETDGLRRELEQAQERARRAEALAKQRNEDLARIQRSKAQTEGKLRALKERAANGVCPCCKRSFVQLARHMQTKHPTWIDKAHKPIGDDHES